MRKNGFTLIELLVVVAIIGILATIAVPNFLCALVKAKVARVQGDFEAVATALEMYAMDNNALIPDKLTLNNLGMPRTEYQVWSQLTTPVGYLGAVAFVDPFNQKYAWEPSTPEYAVMGVYSYQGNKGRNWTTHSIGPSQRYEFTPATLFAPSNGCVSIGGIVRTEAGQR